MRRSALALVSIILMIVPILAPALQAEGTDHGRLLTTPDGAVWTDDVKVSNNPYDDTDPYLFLDGSGGNHILWTRDEDLFYKEVDLIGREAFKERDIAPARPLAYPNGAEAETVAMDGEGDIHVVFKETDWGSGRFLVEKYSPEGERLLGPVEVSDDPAIGAAANMASDGKDKLVVLHERCSYISGTTEGLTLLNSKLTVGKALNATGADDWEVAGGRAVFDAKGWVRAVVAVRSAARVDMWAVTLDGYGIEMPGMEPLYTHSGPLFAEPPVPALAAGPDGRFHMLASDPNADGSRSLTYIIVDHDKDKVETHPVTDQALDDGDIACDGSGRAHIVFTDAYDGDLYYVTAKGGALSEELRLTRNGGARAPAIQADGLGMPRVVWVDNRTGNDEVYYKAALAYAIELSTSPEEQAKIMFIHPSEIKSMNVTVKNVGGLNDTILLNVSIDPAEAGDYGWDAWLDLDEIELDPLEAAGFKVHVKGGSRCIPNGFITITVTATSASDPSVNDTISFRSFIVCNRRVKVEIPDNVVQMLIGEEGTFQVSVTNCGDVTEDIVLEVEDAPVDWYHRLEPTEFTLAPGESAEAELTVIAPGVSLSDQMAMFLVKGWLKDLPSVYDKATAHAIVQWIAIDLEVDLKEWKASPGVPLDVPVTIRNGCSSSSSYVIEVDDIDWETRLSVKVITLYGYNGEFVITIVPPPDAAWGERRTIEVALYNEWGSWVASTEFTVIVGAVHDIRIEVVDPELEVMPGDVVNFHATVTNEGNGAEALSVTVEGAPEDWSVVPTIGGLSADDLLPKWEEADVVIEVKVPADGGAGRSEMMLVLENGLGDEWHAPIAVTVEQYHLVQVTSLWSLQSCQPGSWAVFPFTVTNLGNGPDTFSLRAEGLGDGFVTVFSMDDMAADIVSLGVGASARIDLMVQAPRMDIEPVAFRVEASSAGGARDGVDLRLEVNMPNLVISKVSYDAERFKVGEMVTIETIIRNEGSVAVDLVTVAFYADGDLMGTRTVSDLGAESSRRVVFVFAPPQAGHVGLRFVVDPANEVLEKDEGDNIVEDGMEVEGAVHGVEGVPEASWLGATFGLVALVVIVTIVSLVRRRSRGGKTPPF